MAAMSAREASTEKRIPDPLFAVWANDACVSNRDSIRGSLTSFRPLPSSTNSLNAISAASKALDSAALHRGYDCLRIARQSNPAASNDIVALTTNAAVGLTRVQSQPKSADAGSNMRPLTR